MKCGPFELVEPIGTGGMAEVWRALHGTTPVAVKFVTLARPQIAAAFRAEVRAHARLQHPGILQVLDFGHLDADIAGGPDAGTPWLALELASGGTLSQQMRRQPLGWGEIRLTLLSILDALSHAHAYGVIHRDLKPANVLIATRDDLRPGLKLADFGIAHLQDAERVGESELEVTGTRTSMAPEQIEGAFREYGPWTDLYALGCLAYRMAAGRWPFQGQGKRTLLAHLTTPAPRLPGGLPVPEGFADWVDRLLQKAPRDRPRTAADALHALLVLGDDTPTARRPRSTVADEPTHTEGDITTGTLPLRAALRAAWGDESTATPAGIAPLAADWRRPVAEAIPLPLLDAGLELFPLRSHDPVGREDATDAMWTALREVRQTGRPRAVVLTGAEGIGVSHLGEWFVKRAETLGAAHAFRVRGEDHDAADEALLRALAEDLRVENLRGDALKRVLPATLALWGPADPRLKEVLETLLERQVQSHAVRRGAIRRVLRDRAHGRAVIVWLDNADACPDGLAFALSTLRNPPTDDAPRLPLLFIVGTGPLEGDSMAQARVRELVEHEATRTLDLQRLTHLQSHQLVQHALPLTAALEAPIVAAADGVPARLLRHVVHLVEQGALTNTPRGFDLAPGTPLSHPPEQADDLGVDIPSFLAEPEIARAVTTGAVLGLEVRHDLWARALDDPGGTRSAHDIPLAALRLRVALVERLVEAGAAVETRDGWRFVEPRIRDTVLRSAPEEVVKTARLAVAQVLAPFTEEPGVGLRCARLYRDAGDVDAALAAYQKTLLSPRPQNYFRQGELTATCEEALALLASIDGSHDTHAALWDRLSVRALYGAADTPEGPARSRRMLEEGTRRGWPLVVAGAHSLLATRAAMTYDAEGYAAHYAAARTALGDAPDVPVTMDIRITLAIAQHRSSRTADALKDVEAVYAKAQERNWTRISTRAYPYVITFQRHVGVPIDMQRLLDRAQVAWALGYPNQAAALFLEGGEIAFIDGDYATSDALNEQCLEVVHQVGMSEPAPALNLARNAIMRRDAAATRRWLDRGRAFRTAERYRVAILVLELGWSALCGDVASCALRVTDLEERKTLLDAGMNRDVVSILDVVIAELTPLDPALAAAVEAFLPAERPAT